MFIQPSELYDYCLDEGIADRNLIAKWKKVIRILLTSLVIFSTDIYTNF